jgi:hypothetical protein
MTTTPQEPISDPASAPDGEPEEPSIDPTAPVGPGDPDDPDIPPDNPSGAGTTAPSFSVNPQISGCRKPETGRKP